MRRVREGEEEEEEEENPEEVRGEDDEALRVLQSRADGGETHVVTERVAQHRAHQVTCSEEDECCVGPKHSCVRELEHCREKDARESALSETQQLDHMMEMSDSKEQRTREDGGEGSGAWH